jgi:hypothetical protein
MQKEELGCRKKSSTVLQLGAEDQWPDENRGGEWGGGWEAINVTRTLNNINRSK